MLRKQKVREEIKKKKVEKRGKRMRENPVMHKVRIVAVVLPLNLSRGNKNREQVKEKRPKLNGHFYHLRNERGKKKQREKFTRQTDIIWLSFYRHKLTNAKRTHSTCMMSILIYVDSLVYKRTFINYKKVIKSHTKLAFKIRFIQIAFYLEKFSKCF